MELREINEEDIDLLYKWVNDPKVRRNSFKKEKIDYKEHKKWFEDKLNSDKSFIFILKDEVPIGQIRIDIKDEIGKIDYSIDKKYRGKGYGTKLLEYIFDEINNKDIKIKKIIGEVKYTNKASCKAFEKANYHKKEKDSYIKYYKEL